MSERKVSPPQTYDIEYSYPLSSLQQGMLFHALMEKQSSANLQQILIDLPEKLDTNKFKKAWSRIIRRHPVLRTGFRWDDLDEPQQEVHANAELVWDEQDLRAFTNGEREKRFAEFLAADRRRGFDLARPPLSRLTLLRYGEANNRLVWTYHHILFDGTSRRLLEREVFAYYEAFLRDTDLTLPLPAPFRDYVAWLRQQDFSRDELFWREQLKGFTAPTPLSVDHAPKSSRGDGNRAGTQNVRLSTEIASGLRRRAEQTGVTLPTIMQAAWALLLSRYSGAADIVFGVLRSNRYGTIDGADTVIGLCINTLPMRVHVNPEMRLSLFVEDVRRQWMSIRDHAHTPLANIQGWSEVPVGRPLFTSIFNFQNSDLAAILLQTNYAVGLSVFAGAECHLRLSFDRNCIDDDAVKRMLGHYQVLLEGIVANPEVRIGELPLLTEAERHQLLVEWNQTELDYPRDKCVHQLFEAQVQRTPDRIAVVSEETQLTYRQVNAAANRVASQLCSRGVGIGHFVPILMPTTAEFLIAELAVMKSGAAFVPLDPSWPKKRLSVILEMLGSRIVLIRDSDAADLVGQSREALIVGDWADGGDGANTGVNVGPDDPIYCIFTSGSTGLPKGAINRHGGIINRLTVMTELFGTAADDCLLATSPAFFDPSVWQYFWPLTCGGRSVILPTFQVHNPELIPALMRRHGITFTGFVPSMFQPLVEHLRCHPEVWPAFGSLRRALIGGEALAADPVYKFKAMFPHIPITNTYGPTETSIGVIFHDVPADYTNPIPIGRPIPNVRAIILDHHLNLVPVGVTGELFLGGVCVGLGYLNDPESTARAFIANPFPEFNCPTLYRTGDLVRFRADGVIEYMGRADTQMKLRGMRIEAGEIESVLKLHPATREAVVVVREDKPGDRRLVAYVAPASAAAHTGELQKALKEKLPPYMLPSAFVFIDAFPLTTNGKLDRKALPAPERRSPELDGFYVVPQTPTEETLASIWREVLDLKQVGIHDNFFELGGHSLLAIRVMSRVNSTFQVEMAVRALFENPDIAELAKCIDTLLREDSVATAASIVPVERGQQLPLSFAQERLWFIDQLNPGSTVYNIPSVLWLDGALDAAALLRSLEEVVRRHEALRTRFEIVADRPVQVVAPAASVEMPVIDLSAQPQREADAMRLCREEAQRPFNLARDLMLRVRLFRLEPERHALFINLHHIAADGWSTAVLLRELGSLYEAFCQSQASPLHELPIQYADYAVWQREWLQGEVMEQQLAYWRTQLAGARALLELPTDRPRPARLSSRGASETAVLPGSLLKAIKALSRQEGTTLFTTLLAAFQSMLSRYSGQEDITVGSPIAGRNRRELEGLIGFFANTLVLRGDLSGNPTSRELLRRVKEVTLGAYAHQDLPFEKLVEVLNPERNLNYHPLFQVMFTSNTLPLPTQLGRLGLRLQHVSTATSKFDLAMSVSEETDGLKAKIEYCTDLFDADTIRRMLGHYQVLLEGIATNPEARIAELPLLTEAERHQLLVEWNQTEWNYPCDKCVHQLFEAQVERTPDAIALTFDGAKMSYRELNQRANQLARYLQKFGVGPEALVGICVERSLQMVVGLLGILKTGAAYVPLDPEYPRDRLRFMLQDANVSVLVTQARLVELVPAPRASVIRLDTDWPTIAHESDENPKGLAATTNLAYVIYTSGSTGQPKGVMITHGNIVRLFQAANDCYDFNQTDVWALFHSYAFDFSVWEIWGALLYGGQLVVVPYIVSRSPDEFYKLLIQEGVTVLNQTPSAFKQLMQIEKAANQPSALALRYVIFGGEELELQSLKPWFERHGDEHPRLVNMYGITETTVHVTYRPLVKDDVNYRGLIGVPLRDLQVYILDPRYQPLPIGIAGEIYVCGAGLARGYLNDPELTARKFIPNPFQPGSFLYRTGDFARYLADGSIEFLGRIDNQVKIRGYRIELGEIESVLKLHTAVGECVVVAREDVPNDRRLVAYVAPASAANQISKLQEFLKERLPSFMLPSAFVFVDAFPLTTNGKLDRMALPPPASSRPNSEETFVAPRSFTEEMLAKIWCQALRLDRIGINDNFLDLGAHSLLMTQVANRVQGTFQIHLPLSALFEAPTVASLAARIESSAKMGKDLRAHQSGSYPTTGQG